MRTHRTTDTLIIGAGQAGLAMSRVLTERGVDHVVLERGRIGERWRSERWDSLRLLTPSWMAGLPEWRYRGDEPDGFMTMPEVIAHLEGYAESFGAPIEERATVHWIERSNDGWVVRADRGVWRARAVVIATGHCDRPYVPSFASQLPRDVVQLTPSSYRRPSQLPRGGALVVGASASGVQLADELHRSGRAVTLSVGRHTRLPRRYRGRDIFHWLERAGILDERIEDVRDPVASRDQPSLQLAGRADGTNLDLASLSAIGVTLAGRTSAIGTGRITFADDLPTTLREAERKRRRILRRIDRFIAERDEAAGEPDAPPAFLAPSRVAPTVLSLREAGIRSVLWATGFRRTYPWVDPSLLDDEGQLPMPLRGGGRTDHPGLYVLGLPFLRRRRSTFIGGVGADARELARDVCAHLGRRISDAA